MGDLDFLLGQTVVELRYSVPGGLRIVFDTGDRVEPALYADLDRFEFFNREGYRSLVETTDPASIGPVFTAAGKQIQAVATDGGALSLVFSDASRVRCEPHDDYEAWQVVGGSPQHLVICMPGGELAV